MSECFGAVLVKKIPHRGGAAKTDLASGPVQYAKETGLFLYLGDRQGREVKSR